MGGATGGIVSMDDGIAAAAQAPPAILRKVRRLQSVYCIVITDQFEVNTAVRDSTRASFSCLPNGLESFQGTAAAVAVRFYPEFLVKVRAQPP
jgi:hypothetical protein